MIEGDVWVEMLSNAIKEHQINKLDKKGEVIEKVKINTIEIENG